MLCTSTQIDCVSNNCILHLSTICPVVLNKLHTSDNRYISNCLLNIYILGQNPSLLQFLHSTTTQWLWHMCDFDVVSELYFWGAWVAQLVKCQWFQLRSWSHSSWDQAPHWALCWQHGRLAWDSLSPSLYLSFSLSLSKVNNKNFLKNLHLFGSLLVFSLLWSSHFNFFVFHFS